jgi:ribosomal protein S8
MIKKINTNWYCNFLNLLKLSIFFKLDYIIINYSKKLIPIINILLKINYLNNYKIIDEKTLIIYFYKNQKWKNLKIMYKSSNYFFIDIYNLKRYYLNDFKKILIISTSKGIITHHDAIKFNLGGKIIFYIY